MDHNSDQPSAGQVPHLRVVQTQTFGLIDVESPTFKLDDMVGQATVKGRLSQLSTALRDMVAADHKAANWTDGTLFYGPPRTGKHFCAQVIAGEANAMLIRADMRRLTNVKLIDELEEALKHNPVARIVSLEDIDAVSQADPTTRGQIARLIEVIGQARVESPTLVVASAELPWFASKELVCEQRLGKVLLILPPDAPARAKYILQLCGSETNSTGIDSDDLEWVVKRTDGFSFGDLADLVATCRQMSGADSPEFPDRDTWRRARMQTAPSSSDWLNRAGHHALAGDADGLYDDLLQFFRARQKN